jgi:hypothetical protein
MAWLGFCFVEAAAEPDHHPGDAAIAHDQVRAEADHRDRDLARQMPQQIGEIALVLRHEQGLSRAADAKPGQRRERLVRKQAAAQLRQRRFERGEDVGEGHRHRLGSRDV